MRKLLLLLLLVAPLLAGEAPAVSKEEPIRMTFLAMNDVYEMLPMSDGNGGLARVAGLKAELAKKQPTFAFLAGDVISPSAIGRARWKNERLNGRQMIDALNPFLDFSTLGNHEFDIGEAGLLARLKESHFTWISSNMWHSEMDHNFPNTVPNVMFLVGPADNPVKVGVFSIALKVEGKDYLAQDNDKITVAQAQAKLLVDQGCDIIVALTHLPIEEDKILAAVIPEIDLIMGGHEHENIQTHQGLDFTPITKADANARTVYIHDLSYDRATGELTVQSRLRRVDDSIPEDPDVAATVARWRRIAVKSFENNGIEPDRVVTTPTENLDGREASVRNQPTNLTDILAEAMTHQAGTVGAVFNSGTVRIDDILVAGKVITEYDLLRVLPFGGSIYKVGMRGDVLAKVLQQGMANRGSGGFLQKSDMALNEENQWMINGKPLDPAATYELALSDYLLRGRETGLEILNCTNEKGEVTPGPCRNEGLALIKEAGDIVKALRSGLRARFGNP